MSLTEQVNELNSAEEFLDLFNVVYDPAVIAHKRVHLLRLFRQHLHNRHANPEYADYQQALTKAYCQLQQGNRANLEIPQCANCSECQ